MKKPATAASKSRNAKSGVTLGRERFAKISAVEGIELSAAAKKRASDFDRRGTSGEVRRSTIMQAYRKG